MGMSSADNADHQDTERLGLEELKGLVSSGRLSVAQYYRELDRRGIAHA